MTRLQKRAIHPNQRLTLWFLVLSIIFWSATLALWCYVILQPLLQCLSSIYETLHGEMRSEQPAWLQITLWAGLSVSPLFKQPSNAEQPDWVNSYLPVWFHVCLSGQTCCPTVSITVASNSSQPKHCWVVWLLFLNLKWVFIFQFGTCGLRKLTGNRCSWECKVMWENK